ncbi:hypothetical protein [Streptomyces sp. NPDC089919]|uniref:hypothetical protein n=1 Tax=Streptomyces sp. NPDC089919 TaxID=3155188 RepID=UPI00341F6CE2
MSRAFQPVRLPVRPPLRVPVLLTFRLGRSLPAPVRADRPAWQSPYGPPPRRTRRGRWAPTPVRVASRSVVRRGHVCESCD